ncbi:ARID/BRIGHT DNA binding domain-containing protein [Ditylenchus destructor]|nr:ARID/BRIGHT DNA binding domain-containing protein [Ditylenchus destructor]
MNRRKLLTALDEYLKGITETTEYSSKKAQFYSNLRHFYRKKWGCPLKVPFLQGMEVDMFKLYETVLSLGGWQKVTSMERWPQVLEALEIDEDIQMAEYHVKSLYMRFLAKFEQSETGNDPDEHDSDLMGSRGRSINRAHFGMASSEAPVAVHRTIPVSEYPDYPKLIKSLLSGIPNEVDFAINVCCLLSHPGPYLLRLSECPHLITALAAHCGVFNDGPGSLEDLHTEAWQEQSQHDFLQFWQKSGITDDDILSFMPEFNRSSASSKAQKDSQLDLDETFDPNFGDDRLELKKTVNWRIFQILSIFRNVSFEETNKAPLAGNLPLIKLLIVCCNCRWQQLVNTAFDILSNIASDIDLTMDGSVFSDHLLLKTVSMGMFSDDKFQILRSLETISGLCNNKCNEQLICEFAEERILGRIFTLVTTKDILMCLTTLESLYQMSELGRPSCEVLSTHNCGVDILVDLATTDAASFGASGLAGIKVVEIHGPTGQLHPYQPQRSHPLAAIPPLFPQQSRPHSPFSPPSSPSMVSGRHHQFAPAQPSPLTVVRQNQDKPAPNQTPLSSHIAIAPSPVPGASGHKVMPKKLYNVPIKSAQSTSKGVKPIGSPPPQAVQDVVSSMNPPTTGDSPIQSSAVLSKEGNMLEHMTKAWVREHCQPDPSGTANRGEMYAQYVEYMQSHNMLSGSLQMFINQLKACYPSVIINHSPGCSIHMVDGISFSKAALSDLSKPAQNLAAQHPLMQKMLSSPTTGAVSTSTPALNVLNGHSDVSSKVPVKGEVNDKDGQFDAISQEVAENATNQQRTETESTNYSFKSSYPHKLNGELRLINGIDTDEHYKESETKETNSDINGTRSHRNNDQNMIRIVQNSENETANSIEISVGSQIKTEEQNAGEGKEKIRSVPETPPKEPPKNGTDTPVSTMGSKGQKKRNGPSAVNGTPKSGSKKPKLSSKTPSSTSVSSTSTANETTLQPSKVPTTQAVPSAAPNAQARYVVVDNVVASTSAPPPEYMCEWDGCGRFFHNGAAMLYHNTHEHLNRPSVRRKRALSSDDEETEEDDNDNVVKDENTLIVCRWPSCDGTPRSKWSMVTHLQDHHCSDAHLHASLRKRREMGHYNYLAYIRQQLDKVKEVIQHPGYSRFAAIEAIRRHAFSYLPKDITDDSEGPVTRSMRLTSSLILRNIARHSVEGRRKIRKHEAHLSWMALSRMESSAALAQCLGELAAHSAASSSQIAHDSAFPISSTLDSEVLDQSQVQVSDVET